MPPRPDTAVKLRDLAPAICAALEQADEIVLIVRAERRAEDADHGPSIVAANRQALLTMGYEADDLIGHDLAQLAAGDIDDGAFAALVAAARAGHAHRAEVACRARDGRVLWLGLQLMPAGADGGTARHGLLLGEDVTARRRQQAQDNAVQSLLAKVFVTVDAAVYIIDLKGRFMMTNPAFDRLMGVPTGSLIGTAVLDRYAPSCHAAIAAARARQDEDGQDYQVDTTLIRGDGQETPRRITGVMVQRADLARFRIVTVGAEPALLASPPKVTAGGRIQLIGLAEVRQALGPRWAELKDRAMATAEHVIRRRLAPADTFMRTDDDEGFAVCFADIAEPEASFRAATMGRDIRRLLIGEGETPETAHVFAAAAALPAEAEKLPAGELAAAVKDHVDQRLKSLQDSARAGLKLALHDGAFETEMVYPRDRTEAIGRLVKLPAASTHALQMALSVLPATETASLDVDLMLLAFARECALEMALHASTQLVFVTLGFDVMLIRRRLEACVQALEAFPEGLRRNLVLLVAVPSEGARPQLGTGLPRLRPFCRSLGAVAETLDVRDLDTRALGLGVTAVDAAACGHGAGAEAKVKVRAARLHAQRCRLMVCATPARDAARMFATGADLVSISAERPQS